MEANKMNERGTMPLKLHFNLKQMKKQEILTQIMLVTTVKKQRIRIYTKLRVEPQYWDKQKNCCRIESAPNLRERNRLLQINKQLDKLLVDLCLADEKLAERGKYLTQSTVRSVVEERKTKGSAISDPISYLYQQVEEYLQGLNRRGKRGISTTQTTYYTALKRLKHFCKEQKIKITSFDNFDKKFFTDFSNWLHSYTYQRGDIQKRYTQNTIINTLKVIKNLLHRAYDNEVTDNNYFQKVQTILSSDTSELIYLNEKEIKRLSKVKVKDSTEREIRDMFVVACYTALRISDIRRLNEAVIHKGTIRIYQTKTKEQVEIPILKEIAGLIHHYSQQGFPVFNLNKANETIKELAKRCGIDEMMNCKENRGGEISIKTLPKWKMISFHTARRSCITNLYKRGYPINYIMTLSGHRSAQACQRYMRASSREVMSNFVSLLEKNQAL